LLQKTHMCTHHCCNAHSATVWHVVTSDQEDAILTRKLGAIERINSDLEVRVGEGIISMGESFE
jgi:hypothetical protein